MIMRVLLDSVSREKRRKVRVKAEQRFAAEIGAVASEAVSTGALFGDSRHDFSTATENVRNYVMSSSTFKKNSNCLRRISL